MSGDATLVDLGLEEFNPEDWKSATTPGVNLREEGDNELAEAEAKLFQFTSPRIDPTLSTRRKPHAAG